MTTRHRLYAGAQIGWLILGIGAALAVFSGLAEQALPGLELSNQRGPLAAGAAVVAVAGWIVFGRLRIRTWHAVGREAGLQPDDSSGLLSRATGRTGIDPLPDLAGTVDGRPVRVTTYSTSGGLGAGSSGGASRSFTVVKASLDEPTDESVVIAPSSDGADRGVAGMVPESVETAAVDDEFVVLGESAGERTGEVLPERARGALLDLGQGGVTVGDPTDLILEEMMGGMAGELALLAGDGIEDALRSNPAFDASAVSVSTGGLLVDAETLERQAAAVATIADAVETRRAAVA